MKIGLSGLFTDAIMLRIDIARRAEPAAGYSTDGIIRKKAFESENVIVSQSQVAPGIVYGRHHHGRTISMDTSSRVGFRSNTFRKDE